MEAARVTAAQVGSLACPYCGRGWARDLPWASDAQRQWGWCGVSLSDGPDLLGAILLAPDGREATVMAAWVAPDRIRQGIGRRLVQVVCAGLVGRDVHVVVAHGAEACPTCVALPRAFLRRAGFVRMDDRRLWRLDVDAAIVAQPSALDVIERLVGSLRPIGRPEPAVFGRP